MVLDENEIQFIAPPDKYVAITKDNTVVSQGDAQQDAYDMLVDAYRLEQGKGTQVTDTDLEYFGLNSSVLDTRKIPEDFEEFSRTDELISGQRLTIALMQHGFRPIAKATKHLELIDIRKEWDNRIIIPVREEILDAFVAGFISGNFQNLDDPTRFTQWALEVTESIDA